jgi:hypothetical protein
VCVGPAHTRCSGYRAARRVPALSCIKESLELEDIDGTSSAMQP